MSLFNGIDITNILTLRYNPTTNPIQPKLTWKDFVDKDFRGNLLDKIEQNIISTIQKNIPKIGKKVSISLSSGVDSTLIMAILSRNFPEISVEAISVTFAESIDETPVAKVIAEKFDANYHLLTVDNFFEDLPHAISVSKLPFWDFHWYYIVKKAKSLSNSLLSGDGGDELFGGYTFRYEKFLSLTNQNSLPKDKVKAYLDCHERDWVPDQDQLFGKKIDFSWSKIHDLLTPYFDNPLSSISQVFLADYNGKLLFNMIPLYDKFHQHFDIQYLAPLLSNELISIATHIPHSQKYDSINDTGKIPLRKLLDKYNVHHLVLKRKQGFSVDTANLWKSYGQKLCNYYLDDARIVTNGWIKEDWIIKYIQKEDLPIRYINKFFGLLAFEIWYRLFITKEMNKNDKLEI